MSWQNPHSEAHEVFGLQLRPLTIGHLMLLADLGIDIDRMSADEISVFGFVCAQDHQAARVDMSGSWSKWWVPIYFSLWGRWRGAQSREQAADYLRFHCEGQPCWTEPGRSHPIGAPLRLHLLSFCMGELHMGKLDALDTPVKEALQLRAALLESRGHAKLMSQKDIEFGRWCRQMDEQKAKERANNGTV